MQPGAGSGSHHGQGGRRHLFDRAGAAAGYGLGTAVPLVWLVDLLDGHELGALGRAVAIVAVVVVFCIGALATANARRH